MNEDDFSTPRNISEKSDAYNFLKELGTSNPRINIFLFIFTALFIYLIAGLSWTQLVKSSEYYNKGERQSLRRVLYPGPRGDIYDRNGQLLVGNRPHFAAVVYLEELRNDMRKHYYAMVREKRKLNKRVNRTDLRNEARKDILQSYLNQINGLLGRDEKIDEKAMVRHFSERLILPLPLIKDLAPNEYALLIEQLPVESPIKIYTGSARFYPYHRAASHVLGYVSRIEDIPKDNLPGENLKTFSFKGKIARDGMEKSLDHILSGKTGAAVWRVDPGGHKYREIREKGKLPVRGDSIISSIDAELQEVAEAALQDRTGSVIALDIKTGEVLVIASKPDYDLNTLSPFIPQHVFDDISNRGAWFNRSVQGEYPPASTFKIITAIAAMRTAGLDPDKKYECNSYYTVGPRNLPEHGNNAYGLVDLPFSLQVSSNVYYYQVALETGIKALHAEARRFGFGQKTGIELPTESKGLVPNPAWKKKESFSAWVAGDTTNMAIGQGDLLANPLQLACFTASLARRETRTKPTLIHQTNSRTRRTNHGGEAIGLSDYQYGKIIEGMERAAGPKGTAARIAIPGIRIAAKTGTAEFRSALSVAWTIAFAPIDDPQIAIAVMVEGTSIDHNYYGGTTAAPIARAVFEHYFRNLNLINTRQ